MRKQHTKKLNITLDTIRHLHIADLAQAAGGGQQSANGCTKKNSECNACAVKPELE